MKFLKSNLVLLDDNDEFCLRHEMSPDLANRGESKKTAAYYFRNEGNIYRLVLATPIFVLDPNRPVSWVTDAGREDDWNTEEDAMGWRPFSSIKKYFPSQRRRPEYSL